MKMFEDWCALKGCEPFPASPASVAEFVSEMAPLGMSKLWPAVCEISREYSSRGLADPTLSAPVTLAINDLSQIEPPRSWPDSDKLSFRKLPYDVQICIATREQQREKTVRKAMQEAGELRNKLREFEDGKAVAA